jgi:hypothetical protein
MGNRTDLEDQIVALLDPLVADDKFRSVGAATKSELAKMINDELPEAPFCLVSYAGRDGGMVPGGGVHQFEPRISVIVGGLNYVGAKERRREVLDLLEEVDGVLMSAKIGAAQGYLENTGESLVGFSDGGVEVWEQVYKVKQWLQ